MEVTNIIKGHFNELVGNNNEIAETRLAICKACPIYSPAWGGTCSRHLWISPENDDVSFEAKDGYVRGCGCRLLAKTRLANESCVAGKW